MRKAIVMMMMALVLGFMGCSWFKGEKWEKGEKNVPAKSMYDTLIYGTN